MDKANPKAPSREPALYYCIDLYLRRHLSYRTWSVDKMIDLAYQIYTTHTGKLDLFRHYPRPTMDPEFTQAEALTLVHNFTKAGSCKPILGTQKETTL